MMDSRKRKLPQGGLLGRRVRARAEPEPDLGNFEDDASSGAPSEQDVYENESGPESASDNDDNADEACVSPISFHLVIVSQLLMRL